MIDAVLAMLARPPRKRAIPADVASGPMEGAAVSESGDPRRETAEAVIMAQVRWVGEPPSYAEGFPPATLDLDAKIEELCRRAELWEGALMHMSADTVDQVIRRVRRRCGRDEAQRAWALVYEVLLPRSEQFHGGDSAPDGYDMDAILNDLRARAGSFQAAWKLSLRTLDEVIRAHPRPAPEGDST